MVSCGYESLQETDKTVVLEYIKEIKFFKKQYSEMERSGAETNSPVAVYEEAILDILRSCKFMGYGQGDLIFHKGTVGDNMYIILDGNNPNFSNTNKLLS
jgi:CRP-like cAMP-binding protein